MVKREKMTRLIFIAMILALVVSWGTLAVAKAGGQNGGGTAESAENRSAADIPSPPQASSNTDYRIGVNDVLNIHVWKEQELSRTVPVRPDGKISLPLVGELQASGRTALELRAIITERLLEYVTRPEVTVIVQEIKSQRYFLIGKVKKPGAYPLIVPTSVVQALALAGGFQEFADTGRLTIHRYTEGGSAVRIIFNYKAWVKRKKHLKRLKLRNGDVIIVR